MGRIIAVTNMKGGIGKTTTVVNVGAGLALKGARVLLIDVDAQGNLAPSLGVTARRTIYEVLIDNADPAKCIVSARPNLDLIAADDSLLGAQTMISQRSDWSRVLEQAIRPLKSAYDFILIDSPGSLTVLSANALSASNDLLVPTTIEHLSIKGLQLLFKQVKRLKNSTSSIRIIVPTMFDGRVRQSGAMLKQLQETYGMLVAPPIRVNVKISEASSEGQTIYEYDRRSRGALDYAVLVERLSELWHFHPAAKPASTPGSTVGADVPPNGGSHSQNGRSPLADVQAQPTGSVDASLQTPPSSTTAEPSAPPDTSQPVVTGGGNVQHHTCPQCGHPLRRTTVAGYHVAYCDHCKYKQQELVASRPRH